MHIFILFILFRHSYYFYFCFLFGSMSISDLHKHTLNWKTICRSWTCEVKLENFWFISLRMDEVLPARGRDRKETGTGVYLGVEWERLFSRGVDWGPRWVLWCRRHRDHVYFWWIELENMANFGIIDLFDGEWRKRNKRRKKKILFESCQYISIIRLGRGGPCV